MNIDRQTNQSNSLPPPWSRDMLRQLHIVKAKELIQTHPGFEFHDSISALQIMFQIFDQCVEDFLSALRSFHHEVHFRRLFERGRKPELRQYETRIRQSLFSTTQTALALVDHSRRMKEKLNNAQLTIDYDSKVEECFKNKGAHSFLQELRNLYAHKRFLEPDWNLTVERDGMRQTRFMLTPTALYGIKKDWNLSAKAFIDANPKGVDLEPVLIEYRNLVDAFQRWFIDAIRKVVGQQIREYLDYQRFLNGIGAYSMWNLLLSQIVIQNGRDPYQYLDRFLTAEEIERVMALPMNSKAQADLIITLLDEFDACDDQLRRTVYRAFRVP